MPAHEESERYFHALVKEYENARSDERNWFVLAGVFITLIVTALGAIAFGTQSDTFQCLQNHNCGRDVESVLVLAPLAPLAALGMIALLAMQSAIRHRYMRLLEAELRQLSGQRVGDLPGSATRPYPALTESAFLLRWTDLTSGVNEIRRGQTLYRLVLHSLFIGITLIYGALLYYIGTRIGPGACSALIAVYSLAGAMLIGALLKSWFGADALWEEVTAGAVLHPTDQGLGDAVQLDPMPDRREQPRRSSLMGYLFFPRTSMLFWRTLITFGTALALAYLAAASSPSHRLRWVLGVAALISICFEWGPYTARNQWTDLRRRERLPKAPTTASHRANIYTSAVVLALRIAIPYAWVLLLAPSLSGWAPWIGVVLLVSVLVDAACEYRERKLGRRTPVTLVGEAVARAIAFVARALAVWQIAGFLAHAPIAPTAAWVMGIGFAVLSLPWVLHTQLRDRVSRDGAPSGRATRAYAKLVGSALVGRVNTSRSWLRRAPRRGGKLLGEVLFGRSFDAWIERKQPKSDGRLR